MNALQFTHWMEDEADCHEWFHWFEERGIPAAIISNGKNHDNGYDRYCLVRQGDIYKYYIYNDVSRAVPAKLQKMPSNYKVLRSCHGFVE